MASARNEVDSGPDWAKISRLFDQLPSLDEEERLRTDWLQHCRGLPDDVQPPRFAEWRDRQARLGNREGENHD